MAAYATLPLSPDAIAQKTIEQLVAKVDAGQQELERQLQINRLVALQGELTQLIIDQGKHIRALDSRVDDLKRVISCLAYALGAQPKINHALLQQDMATAAEQFWPLGALAPDIARKIGISAAEATERSIRSTRPATFDLALSQVRIGRKSR